jgi:hypothetical protein
MSTAVRKLTRSKIIRTAAFFGLVLIGYLVWITAGRGLLDREARDNQRRRDLQTIVSACYQYALSHDGVQPPSLTGEPTDIGTAGLDLSADLVPEFLLSLPVDPLSGDAAYTGYLLSQEADGRLTAAAAHAEFSTVAVTR